MTFAEREVIEIIRLFPCNAIDTMLELSIVRSSEPTDVFRAYGMGHGPVPHPSGSTHDAVEMSVGVTYGQNDPILAQLSTYGHTGWAVFKRLPTHFYSVQKFHLKLLDLEISHHYGLLLNAILDE